MMVSNPFISTCSSLYSNHLLILICLSTDEKSKSDKGQYEKFAIEQKKMFRIGSVECNEFNKICENEGITEYPTYRVYPPFPVPHSDLMSGESGLDTDRLKKMAFRHIGDRVIEVTSTNHDVFKDDNPGKPKVLLFTESKKAPIVLRALSEYFDVSKEALAFHLCLTPVLSPAFTCLANSSLRNGQS